VTREGPRKRPDVGVGTAVSRHHGSHRRQRGDAPTRLDVVAELGYEPNAAARGPLDRAHRHHRRRRPFFTRPSVMERLRGVALTLAAADYQLVLFDVERPQQGEAAFRSRSAASTACCRSPWSPAPRTSSAWRRPACPSCSSIRSTTGCPACPSTTWRAAGWPTQHLLDLGHRRIAFAGDTVDPVHAASASARRCVGYQGALGDAGVPVRPEMVKLRPHGRAAAEVARGLLSLAEPPTAVFASCDLQALAMMEAFEALGARVPQDVSVGRLRRPGSRALRRPHHRGQPLELSGRRGAELLLARLGGERAGDRASAWTCSSWCGRRAHHTERGAGLEPQRHGYAPGKCQA
jgi:LacI family transcriptional regulator